MEPNDEAIRVAEKKIIDYLLNFKWDEDVHPHPIRKVLKDLMAPLEKWLAEAEGQIYKFERANAMFVHEFKNIRNYALEEAALNLEKRAFALRYEKTIDISFAMKILFEEAVKLRSMREKL